MASSTTTATAATSMSSPGGSHYALVHAGSNPVLIPDDGASLRNDPRQELTQLYQRYAELYPNPRLVEEYRMKHELLQATMAAANANGGNNFKKPATPSRANRGLFARLFGRGGTPEPLEKQVEEETLEAPLVYHDVPFEGDDGSMCGTQASLDRSCIPLEAMNVARFHLTSQATRGTHHPNAVRWGPLLGRAVPTSLVIVGLGMIAEFRPNQASTILSTSDRAALVDYSRTRSGEFRVEYVRACGISPNCIAVSWGFLDGLVGIYRRIQFPDDERCGWEQLWLVQPSPPVMEASRDVFEEDEGQHEAPHPAASPLLRVVDLLPLRVMTGDRGRPMVATLAIARLGCHLELLPIPTDLWFGPLLTPENHRRPRTPKRKPGQHYSFGKYIGSPTVALTTGDHHLDVLAMEALRTTVGVETEWNQQAFPDGPPSEYIVALSGLSRQSPGHECITFWTVCTLFTNDGEENDNQQNALGFGLHSTFLQNVFVSPGADVALFATPEIMKNWRMPRHVELRPDAPIAGEASEKDSEAEAPRVTTVSTPAPIISMHFMDQKGGSLLAVVDWNGGTTLFDCAPMERTAAQSLSWGEQARLDLAAEEGKPKPSMLRMVVSRSEFSRAIGRRNQVGVLQWLNVDASETQNHYDGSCSLVVLLSNEKKLLIVSFDFRIDHCEDQPQSSTVSLPFPGDGAVMGDLGVGNIFFLSKVKVGEDSYKLKFFVMQNLPPTAIVKSLAREGKYEEAIAASKSLHALDQETLIKVLEECHCRVWETKRDIDHLADTRNVPYVVHQAVSICESPSERDADMSIDNVRLLCQLAMAMGRNHEPVQDSIRKLRIFLVRLGTYELLCRCCGTSPNLAVFYGEFQKVALVDLAMNLAERGDIAALSVIVFRHRYEMVDSIISILSSIPPSTDLEAFVHLIPVIRNGQETDNFLPTTTVEFAELHISQMPKHLKDSIGVSLVLDRADEKHVLEHNAMWRKEAYHGISISEAVGWLESRSTMIQDSLGDLHSVILLCEVGMWCNGFDIATSTVPKSELQHVFRIWCGATSLRRILLDDFLLIDSNTGSNVSSAVGVTINDLLSMDLPDVLDFILRGESNISTIREKCSNYLQPLLLDLNREDTGHDGASHDSALASYCTKLVADFIALLRQDPHDARLLTLATKALGTSAAIASSSNSSIKKQDRLVKDTRVLVEMVLEVIYGMASALEEASSFLLTVERECVDAFWSMYESLPDQVPSSMPDGDKLLPLLKRLDTLSLELTCVDILSAWPGSKPLSFLSKHQQAEIDFDLTTGTEVVVRLCRVFFANLLTLKSKDKPSVLLDNLLFDVKQVNMSCCQGRLPLPELLAANLVVSLLESEYFALIVQFSQNDSSLVDHEQVKNKVLSFIDDAVFSDKDSGNRVKAAMKCQDIVGPVFPEIQPGLADMRRYLDAVHFIATVIFEGRASQVIRPSDLRKQLPFDTIESIVRDKPQSILCGCPQWQDAAYAVSANETLRSTGLSGQPHSDPHLELPVLPGGAIFHLATVLGLSDEHAAVAVKCRVIHYALSIGLHGAAAAVSWTFFGQDVAGIEGDAVSLAKLGAVAQVVDVLSYNDLETKYELCRVAFVKFSGHLEISNTSSFARIVDTLATLDHQRSRHAQDLRHFPATQNPLLSRPHARLQKHILSEYNADVHGLFSDLLNQTSNGMVHDSLMNALSRFVIYWCVADSKTLRHRVVMSEKNDAIENWALGCSLILHIPSKLTACNCVHELQKVASDQASLVSSEARFGKEVIRVPDPEIVARMVHRGYSETAARRAAVMTQNAGYNEALGWAFAHANESYFDEPIVVVLDQNRRFIDDSAINMLHQCLHATQSWVDDTVAMERLRDFLRRHHGDSRAHQPQIFPKEAAISRTPREIHTTNLDQASTIATKPSTVPPKPPSPRQESRLARIGTSEASSTAATPLVAPAHESNLARSGTSEALPSEPNVPVAARFPSRLASPRDTGEARLALMRRGQEALSKRRTQGEIADRTKLIANGRELLQKSRSTKMSSEGILVPTPQPPIPRNVAATPPAVTTNHPASGQNGSSAKEVADSSIDYSGWDFDNFDDM